MGRKSKRKHKTSHIFRKPFDLNVDTSSEAERLRLALCETYYYGTYKALYTRSGFARLVVSGSVPGIQCTYHPDHIVRVLRRFRKNRFDTVVDHRREKGIRQNCQFRNPKLHQLIRGLRRELRRDKEKVSMSRIRDYVTARYPRFRKYSLRTFYRAWNSLSAVERAVTPEELADLKKTSPPSFTRIPFEFGDVVYGDWMKIAKNGLKIVDDRDGTTVLVPELLGHIEAKSRACCAIKLCRSQPTTEDAVAIARDVLLDGQTRKLGLSSCCMASRRWHTDRGSAYTALIYRIDFEDAHILLTRSRPQQPTDNPFIERFWQSLRRHFWRTMLECLGARWEREARRTRENDTRPVLTLTFSELESLIVKAVQYYNTRAVHSSIRTTPAEAWMKRASTFKPEFDQRFYDECMRMRERVTLTALGSFELDKIKYYCRGLSRHKRGEAVVTWKPGADRSRVRVYFGKKPRGLLAYPVFEGTREERQMRKSFADECDIAQSEANAAGALAREELLGRDESLGACNPRLCDQDVHLERKEKEERKRVREESIARRDAEHDASAQRLTIIPVPAPNPPEKVAAETPISVPKLNVRKGAK